MPFNFVTQGAAAVAQAVPPGSPLRFVIVHYDAPVNGAGRLRSVTLDFPNQQMLSAVHHKLVEPWVNGNGLVLLDAASGGIPTGFHLDMHNHMMQVMNVQFDATLTDYHQHWVNKGTETLDPNALGFLLMTLKKAQYLSNANVQHLTANVQM